MVVVVLVVVVVLASVVTVEATAVVAVSSHFPPTYGVIFHMVLYHGWKLCRGGYVDPFPPPSSPLMPARRHRPAVPSKWARLNRGD